MILLDTHIWVNWILLGRDALKPAIASAIEDADRVVISAISCFEVTLLVKGRKLELPIATDEWLREALEQSGVECLPITCLIAQRSVKLTDIHRDPADRIIIATALEYRSQLASYDTAFPSYPELSGYLLTGLSI
jgi:PIN domain nuclease of toxin-antitoxin system